ncbi:hypothetical protein [Streptomyces sp. NPDC096030]|uniref:hypothetical protein n=1 Tax=Streptomyces sp. NPDC096030 TaxID=3155423 RepID=UPI00332BFA0E
MNLTLIKTPTDTDLAWAEHQIRQEIIDRFVDARTQTEATAARWGAIAYDRANPLASSLLAELDTYDLLSVA